VSAMIIASVVTKRHGRLLAKLISG
jgi:hypothetical protein